MIQALSERVVPELPASSATEKQAPLVISRPHQPDCATVPTGASPVGGRFSVRKPG